MEAPANKGQFQEILLSDSIFPLSQKRELLFQIQNDSGDWLPIWKRYIAQKEASNTQEQQRAKRKIYWRLGKVSLIPLFLLVLGWWVMLSGGISIYAFPGMAWQARKALSALEDKAPQYYKLVTDNVDTLRFEYIEQTGSLGRGGYARQERNKKVEIIILIDQAKDLPLLASTMVHKACHGKQFHDGRIEYWERSPLAENRQKVEHECLLLGLDVLEILNGDPRDYEYYKSIGTGSGNYGDSWKKEWDGKDTTNGLIDLLSPKYREWYFDREGKKGV